MKLHSAIFLGVYLAVVLAAPQSNIPTEAEPQSVDEIRQSSEISSPDAQQPTTFRPGEVLNQFAGAVGEVANAPAVLIALAFYPLACAIREGGCRRSFDGVLNFSLTNLKGDMDRLKQQVKEAADVDVTNDTEFKPLVDAFENGKTKVVKLYLQNGKNAKSVMSEDEEQILKILLKPENELIR